MSVRILKESGYSSKRQDWVFRLYGQVSIDLMDVALEESHFVQGSDRFPFMESLLHSLSFYTYEGKTRVYLENGDELGLIFDVNSDTYIVFNATRARERYEKKTIDEDDYESLNIALWNIFDYTPKEAVEEFKKV